MYNTQLLYDYYYYNLRGHIDSSFMTLMWVHCVNVSMIEYLCTHKCKCCVGEGFNIYICAYIDKIKFLCSAQSLFMWNEINHFKPIVVNHYVCRAAVIR